MPNNNTEATTYIKFDSQIGAVFSYSSLSLNSADRDIDQLEVVREFAWHSPAISAAAPDAEELKTVYTLPNLNKSGSPMWVIDTINKTIEFSSTESHYEWKNGDHHSRGVDIDLPIYEAGHLVTIRRKTGIKDKNQSWTTGSKVTATRLNSQFTQIINIAQEIRSFLLNPRDFDTYIGNASGICPLDGNNKVPLEHIPSSLGGGEGEATVDVSGNTIGQLSNVSSASATAGNTLIYDSTNGWEPQTAISGVVAVGSAADGHILNWNNAGLAWALAAFSLGSLSDVVITSANQGDVVFWNGSNWINSQMTAPDSGDLLSWDGSKWGPVAFSGSITSDELSVHSLSELGDLLYIDGYDWQDNDFMALFNLSGIGLRFKAKSVDAFDLNDIYYEGPDNVGLNIESGWTWAWNSAREKQDGQLGSWEFGDFGHMHNGINVSTAGLGQVLKVTTENNVKRWKIADFRLNHIDDVAAVSDDQLPGYVLTWDSGDQNWQGKPGGGGGSTSDANIVCEITYDGGEPIPNGANGNEDDFFYTWSPPVKCQITGMQYLFGTTAGDSDTSGNGSSISGGALSFECRKTNFAGFRNGWTTWDSFFPAGSTSDDYRFRTSSTTKLRAQKNTENASSPWYFSNWDNNGIVEATETLVFKPLDCYIPSSSGSSYRPPMTLVLAFKEV
jgi:hypothetical protein